MVISIVPFNHPSLFIDASQSHTWCAVIVEVVSLAVDVLGPSRVQGK